VIKGNAIAVISFDTDGLYTIKGIVLDNDREAAVEFLKRLDRRIDEATTTK
jgi:hypothetical protein